jgi:ElaA protein
VTGSSVADPHAAGPYVAGPADLDVPTLYALLRLRGDIFVVEQQCPYRDIDDRDLEPGTRHLWYGPNRTEPLAYLRLLTDPDGTARIGRVCTAVPARGGGLSARLMTAALDLIGDDTACVLDAQAYLVDFYRRFGFAPSGEEYVEDGIAHVPMRRGIT